MASVRAFSQADTGTNLQDRTIANPVGTTDGDLLLMFGVLNTAGGNLSTNLVLPTGWTELASTNDGLSMSFVAWHRYAAADPNPIAIHGGAVTRTLAIGLYAVKDAGTPVISAVATAFNNAPDSSSVTIPGPVGAHLFFSFAGISDSGNGGMTITAWPAGYNNTTVNTPTGGAIAVVGSRSLAAASDNPAAYTMVQVNAWLAWTVGAPDTGVLGHQGIAQRSGPLRHFRRY